MSDELNKDLEEVEVTPEMEEIQRLMDELDQKVDAEKYNELELKYKKLLSDYTSRRPAPKPKEEKLRKTSEIAREFSSIEHGDVSNREYIKKALEYRKAHIAEFGTDPFTDFGAGGPGQATPKTNRVAEGLQMLIDNYKTDSLFNAQLQELLKDDVQLLRQLRNRKK